MNILNCDIHLGGSTSKFLIWHKTNSTRDEFISSLVKAITYRAKTIPHKQARRSACLMGLIYDQLDGDEYLLDVLISAIHKLREVTQ